MQPAHTMVPLPDTAVPHECQEHAIQPCRVLHVPASHGSIWAQLQPTCGHPGQLQLALGDLQQSAQTLQLLSGTTLLCGCQSHAVALCWVLQDVAQAWQPQNSHMDATLASSPMPHATSQGSPWLQEETWGPDNMVGCG